MCKLRGLGFHVADKKSNPWLESIQGDTTLSDNQREMLTLFETDDTVTHLQVLGRVAGEMYDHENL